MFAGRAVYCLTLLVASTVSLFGTTHFSSAAQSSHGFVYVADPSARAIEIYRQEGSGGPVDSISAGIDGPLGLALSGGTLYVANNVSGTVLEYARGSHVPTATLTGTESPIGITVGSDGTVYACSGTANICNEYASGSTTPTLSLALPCPFAPALDAQNNLYIVYNGICNGISRVVRYAPGSTKARDLGIHFRGASGDIEIDRAGNILVGNVRHGRIDIYTPGEKMPARSILTGYPYMFTLNREENTLFVAGGVNFPPIVVKFDYRTGKETGTITSGLSSTSGVAVRPEP
jgi:hypothetical protein